MSQKADQPKRARQEKVFLLSRPSRCHNCDRKLERGELVKLEKSGDETEALCRSCSGLDELELLSSGHAGVTRLAKKYSRRCYTVMQWSELWKCYERQGLLLEPVAIDRAEKECGDAKAPRERR